MRQNSLAENDGAAQIELPGALPVVQRGIEKRFSGRAAGIRNADVHASKARLRGLHKGSHRRGVGDVERLGMRLDAKAAPCVGRDLIEFHLATRAKRKVCALGGKRQGRGPSDARARASHNGHSAFHSRVHAPYDSRGSSGQV
jgi:hypothetical protein